MYYIDIGHMSFSLISIIEVVEPVTPVTGREQEDGGGDAVNYCKRWIIM